MTDNNTGAAELDRGDEIITLLVLARERPDVARALLAAADTAGVEPFAVRTTSDGFEVPRRLAELAGLVLAEDVDPLDHLTPVYAAALANGVDQVPPPSADGGGGGEVLPPYGERPAEDVDEQLEPDAEAPRARKAGRTASKGAGK